MRRCFGLMIASLLTLAAAPAAAQEQDPRRAMIAGLEQGYEQSKEPSLKFFIAERYAELGDREKALESLKIAAASGRQYYPGPQSALAKYNNDPEFAPIVKELDARLIKSSNGTVAYRFEGSKPFPEGVAFDPVSHRLFFGDWRTNSIYSAKPGRAPQRLAILSGVNPLGMTVDAKRRLLWVATNNAFSGGKPPRSELISIDLRTGKQRVYRLPEARGMNDVALAPNGDVYISDNATGAVLRLKSGKDTLDYLTKPESVSFPNGLTVEPGGKYLFLAQGLTPLRITLATGEISRLKKPKDLDMIGTDGFYFRDGALYAIQNLVTPGRILRLKLNPAMDEITGYDLIESANPLFDLPTTGAFDGDSLLVIANSELYKVFNGPQQNATRSKPLTILRYKLK